MHIAGILMQSAGAYRILTDLLFPAVQKSNLCGCARFDSSCDAMA